MTIIEGHEQTTPPNTTTEASPATNPSPANGLRASVQHRALNNALRHAGRIIPNRSGTTPGGNLLRLEFTPQRLTLAGCNADVDYRTTLPAECSGHGTLALPAGPLAQVVNSINADEIDLTVEESELRITGGSFTTRFQLVNLDQIQAMSFPDTLDTTLDAAVLAQLLTSARYAAAQAEYQAVFRGVRLELTSDRTRAIATDGFRLAMYDAPPANGLEQDFLIPARTVDEILRTFNDGDVMLGMHGQRLSLANQVAQMNISLMDGQFPDYQRVIPTHFQCSVTVDAGVLAEAVSRVAVITSGEKNHRIDLVIQDGTLTLHGEGAFGSARESLSVQQEGTAQSMQLAFNARYLADALARIKGPTKLDISGQTSPAVFRGTDNPQYLAMVVPLRTT